MTRFRATVAALLVLCLAAATAGSTNAASADDDDGRRIAMDDDCDPSASGGWNPSPPGPQGGCLQKRGNVSVAEFGMELGSAPNGTNTDLAAAVVGHQSWRMDPPYLVIKPGQSVRVKNTGGRPHTFTKVNQFGAGSTPPGFNEGLTPNSPDPCAAAGPPIGAGDSIRVSGLAAGNHKFICCIHPWMRALIKVKPGQGGGGDDD
jgi:plastocyanin